MLFSIPPAYTLLKLKKHFYARKYPGAKIQRGISQLHFLKQAVQERSELKLWNFQPFSILHCQLMCNNATNSHIQSHSYIMYQQGACDPARIAETTSSIRCPCEQHVNENLSVVGKKVELLSG
jgi:hypothetical protein